MSPLRSGKLPINFQQFTSLTIVTVPWHPNPPRPHHPPLHRGSHRRHLAAGHHRRVITLTLLLGSPKYPTPLTEECGTKLPFLSLEPRTSSMSGPPEAVLVFITFFLFVCHSTFVPLSSHRIRYKPIFTTPFIGSDVAICPFASVVGVGQVSAHRPVRRLIKIALCFPTIAASPDPYLNHFANCQYGRTS